MKFCKKFLVGCLLVLLAAPVLAQSQQERERAEQQAQAAQARAEAARADQAVEVEVRMREAERQLEDAARRIAELSDAQLARAGRFKRQWVFETNRPVIGVTIGSDRNTDNGPVEGVSILGITPGGAAEESGLRSGDIITAVNGDSMSSGNSMEANRKLLDFMQGVEEGDVLEIEYLRENKSGSVELVPTVPDGPVIDFRFGGTPHSVPVAPSAPQVFSSFKWVSRGGGHGFGDMEMVELNEQLGRYFGTDSGLLIVKAPDDNTFKLQDGDVIKNIDGRTPKDLHHAIRILSSYQSGETVKIEIMRDKRQQTIEIEIPDNRQSLAIPGPEVAPTPPAAPSIVVVPKVRIVTKKGEEST